MGFSRSKNIILLCPILDEIDNKIRIGNMFIKTMYSSRNLHLLCWIFSKGLYGKLGWGFVGKNNICFSIRIDNNKIEVVRSKREEELYEANDLKQIFPC
jgi:hypothetical protein